MQGIRITIAAVVWTTLAVTSNASAQQISSTIYDASQPQATEVVTVNGQPLTALLSGVNPYLVEGPTNTAVGQSALASNTTGAYNTGLGAQALFSNTGGSDNTATGSWALRYNTIGSANTATGYTALYLNLSGYNNTATGAGALSSNTFGNTNTASGANALAQNNTGAGNTANGAQAMLANTTGTGNTASGYDGLRNSSGSYNAAFGYEAGASLSSGSYNVYLGANVKGTLSDNNTMRLGALYNGTTGVGQNQTFIAGIYDTQLTGNAVQVFVDANGQLGTFTPPALTGTGTVSPTIVALQQQAIIADLQDQLRNQQTITTDLLARVARLEALGPARPGRK